MIVDVLIHIIMMKKNTLDPKHAYVFFTIFPKTLTFVDKHIDIL